MITAKGGYWKVIASSVAGGSHLAAGIPCQDAYAYRILGDGTLIGAVADGAGSSQHAEQGSSLAAQSAIDYLDRYFVSGKPDTADRCRSMLRDCVFHIRSRLQDKAASSDCRAGASCLNDFATTLIAFFITESYLGAVQIGDGAIVYRETPNTLVVACKPEHGEYLNETYFITSEDFEQHCQFKIAPSQNVDALAVFSDGLQMLALMYVDNSAHGPFFNPLFGFASQEHADTEALQHFLLSDGVCERSDDDKTLILTVRMPANSYDNF